jgi:GMP synthase (glutamine-hydrolysing)
LPLDWLSAGALVVLGGSMSVHDTASHPFLAEEVEMLRSALREGFPVLGICLGAQLLAMASGAEVFPGPSPELGWAEMSLTTEGRQDPVLAGVGDECPVFHWHGDTFSLPSGGVRLASSALTLNQAFRVGRFAYGFQFHLEVEHSMIEEWVRLHGASRGGKDDDGLFLGNIEADTVRLLPSLRETGKAAFGRFLDLAEGRG